MCEVNVHRSSDVLVERAKVLYLHSPDFESQFNASLTRRLSAVSSFWALCSCKVCNKSTKHKVIWRLNKISNKHHLWQCLTHEGCWGNKLFLLMDIPDTLENSHILNSAEILPPDDCWCDLGPSGLWGIFFSFQMSLWDPASLPWWLLTHSGFCFCPCLAVSQLWSLCKWFCKTGTLKESEPEHF